LGREHEVYDLSDGHVSVDVDRRLTIASGLVPVVVTNAQPKGMGRTPATLARKYENHRLGLVLASQQADKEEHR
jgi:hypothetical protein